MSDSIFTFGEIMLRISPKFKSERIIQTEDFKIEPGGSESNVAINLANLGNSTRYFTKLPDNVLGNKILRYLNRYNVDTSEIILAGEKMGTYWTEHGIGPRASFVIYDRKNSAINTIKEENLNLDALFEGVDWFHSSGITPALSKNCMQVLGTFIDEADDLSINISLDLNYRDKLWRWIEKSNYTIEDVMNQLSEKCDVLVGNESDFQNMFNISSDKENQIDRYKYIAEKVFSRFENLGYMAVSLRNSISASENKWSGLLFVSGNGTIKCLQSREYHLKNVVDRVGGGDSFASGLIHGLREEMSNERALEFAAGFSALKHTVRGDISEFSKSDVEHLIETKASGRIVR